MKICMKVRLFLIVTALCMILFSVGNTLKADVLSSSSPFWPLPDGAVGRVGNGKITAQVAASPINEYVAIPSLGSIWIFDFKVWAVKARVDSGDLGDWFTSVTFSPDGTKIAGGTKYGKVHVADVSTGTILQTMSASTGTITSIAFRPDGVVLVVGSTQGRLLVYDATKPQFTFLQNLNFTRDAVMGLAFTPDSRVFITCYGDHTYSTRTFSPYTVVWKLISTPGRVAYYALDVARYETHDGGINTLSISKLGNLMASAGMDNTVWVVSSRWKWHPSADGKRLSHPAPVYAAAFSPTVNHILVTACADKKLRVWNVVTGTFYEPYQEHRQAVTSVQFGHDGTYYISSSGSIGGGTNGDSLVMKYPIGAGGVPNYMDHTNDIQSVAFSPDGTLFATKSWDTNTRVYKNGEFIKAFVTAIDQQCFVSSLAFSNDNKTVLSVESWNDVINVFKMNAFWTPVKVLSGHTAPIFSVAYSPDSTKFASASQDKTVRVWDASDLTTTYTLEGHTDSVYDVAFSKDSDIVASGSYDMTIRLWDADTGTHIRTLTGHTNGACSIAFSPTVNNKLVSAGKGNDTTVRIWNTDTGKALHVLTPAGYVGEFNSVAFSRDGNIVAAASYDATVRLWNVTSGNLIETLRGHAQSVTSVAFSPTEDILASGSSDGTALLWTVRSETEEAVAPPLISRVHEISATNNADRSITSTALFENYPNPFNPETWIPYQLVESADVSIDIYSDNGTLIRTLRIGRQTKGLYESRSRAAYWDGRNSAGESVASGVYFYTLTAGEFSATRKMSIVK